MEKFKGRINQRNNNIKKFPSTDKTGDQYERTYQMPHMIGEKRPTPRTIIVNFQNGEKQKDLKTSRVEKKAGHMQRIRNSNETRFLNKAKRQGSYVFKIMKENNL